MPTARTAPRWSPTFSSSRLSLLDRGVIYALRYIRGGGELGEEWREQGRMMQKMNTFTDFIDCADYLVKNRYTSTDRLVIQGGSAGGLLMGAVVEHAARTCSRRSSRRCRSSTSSTRCSTRRCR